MKRRFCMECHGTGWVYENEEKLINPMIIVGGEGWVGYALAGRVPTSNQKECPNCVEGRIIFKKVILGDKHEI